MPSDPRQPFVGATYGRYSDGRSAVAHDVNVSFGLSGLQITPEHGTPVVWSYGSLKSGEPLRPTAVDVLLSSSEAPGASLFVPGLDFATALSTYAPQLTARAERWRHARPWLALVGAIAAGIALIYAAGWSPIKAMAGLLPETWRERLGDEARDSMVEGRALCTDAAGSAALLKLSERMSKAAGRDKPFRIAVYDWSLMNAFAVPGGQIVLTRGLIEKSQSADEVAGVVAHEMGHGIELHPETGIIRAIGLSAALELMMGGSGGTLGNVGLVLAQLGYTRAAEAEADLVAITVLRASGIAVKGLGDFFKRVADMEGESGGLSKTLKPFTILRTHPPSAERAALVRRQAGYPATPALDAHAWDELRNICKTTQKPDAKPSAPQ